VLAQTKTIARTTGWLLCAALAACGGDDDPADVDAAGGADAADVDSAVDTRTVVTLDTTLGDLVVRLEDQRMPITTANFLGYVDSGFFDGTLIHRVQDDWVIQGGGYTTGMVPTTPEAPIELETHPDVSHVHGAISMARTADPNSANSQWFIVDWPTVGNPPQPDQLDGAYAAFGVMIEGFDVLENITLALVHDDEDLGLENVPDVEIVVTSATRR
jgi:peptidyl-prolyl cis-trans isomerase A (cyclophilin A)